MRECTSSKFRRNQGLVTSELYETAVGAQIGLMIDDGFTNHKSEDLVMMNHYPRQRPEERIDKYKRSLKAILEGLETATKSLKTIFDTHDCKHHPY